MKIYKLTYIIEGYEYKIKILNPEFVNKYKGKCLIISKNKKYPLKSLFSIRYHRSLRNIENQERILNILEIKLISYIDITDPNEMTKGCLFFTNLKEKNKKFKINIKEYGKLPGFLIYQSFRIIYNIEPNKKEIKIFGKYFVEKNKDKCIFIYKGKIFSLLEYFPLKENKGLKFGEFEILLVIFNSEKNLIFQEYNKILTTKEKYFELKNNINKEENNQKFEIKDEKKEENFAELFNNFERTGESKDFFSEFKKNENDIKEKLNLINFDDSSDKNTLIEVYNLLPDLNPKYIISINSSKNNIFSINESSRIFDNKYDDIILIHILSGYPSTLSFLNKSSSITDLGFMFHQCSTLISLPDINLLNTSNVTKMYSMFSECSSLISLPDLSSWNTANVKSIDSMFYRCSSLIYLSGISKWNTKNITDMSCLFNECSKLKYLPDISKWDTKNLTKLYKIFYKCSSLVSLPDISKWNTNKIIDMNCLFSECLSLLFLPDISKWDTQNVQKMDSLFCECSSLVSLPDIYKWNTINVYDMKNMLSKCFSLKKVKNITNWKLENVYVMENMFYQCKSLEIIPGESDWKINNVKNMSHMFYDCFSLKSLSHFINAFNLEEMENMFLRCISLKTLDT